MTFDPRKDAQRDAGDEIDRLRAAASRFFSGEYRLSILGGSPGYSGSAFARVEAPGGSWLLRRWPPGYEEGRLRFVHRALLESRSRGFTGVPDLARTKEGETVVRVAGRLCDAQAWLAGEALFGQGPGSAPVPNVVVHPSAERLRALAESLARFYLSAVRLPREGGHRVSPLPERLEALTDEVRERGVSLSPMVRAAAEGEVREIALRWLGLLPHAVTAAREVSEMLPGGARGHEVLCHGDLWPAHVRFDGDSLTGFTDFESLTFASPTFDLVQLVTHFGGWETKEAVLRSYETVAPLRGSDRDALSAEAIADLAGEGLWSLGALYGESSARTTPAQRAAHELNLRRLVGSLERAVEEAEGTGG